MIAILLEKEDDVIVLRRAVADLRARGECIRWQDALSRVDRALHQPHKFEVEDR